MTYSRRVRTPLLTISLGIILAAALQASPVVVLTGRTDSNLTANVENYSLLGNSFTFTLFSVDGVLANGSITSIGFNFGDDGVLNTAALVSSTNANYTLADGPLAANATGFAATLDFALLTGSNFNGGGNPNNGITPGSSATFTVTDNFGGRDAGQIANSMVARFQGSGDVAVADGRASTQATAPEPGTFILLGAGLISWILVRRGRMRW